MKRKAKDESLDRQIEAVKATRRIVDRARARKAKKPPDRRYQCIDIGPSRGFEYKWVNPEMARHLFRQKEGWKRYFRGNGRYRMGWDLLRRPIPKPVKALKPVKAPKATRQDIVELHAQLTTWLNAHR